MRHAVNPLLLLCILASTPLHAADAAPEKVLLLAHTQQSSEVAIGGENPTLRERIAGTIVMVKPRGGIVAVDVASLQIIWLRPANTGFSAINSLSEPDEDGRIAFVGDSGASERGYAVSLIGREAEKVLFKGPGDPLWDHAISPISLAPRGGRIAFVAQPLENEGRQFRPLVAGPLRVWDPANAMARDLGITATGERPSWFPDGRRLVYVAKAAAEQLPQVTDQSEPTVRLLDTNSGEESILAAGHLPIVASDGKTVLVTRGRSFELFLIDVATRSETKVPRVHGLGTPLALIDSRYLIYKGATSPGAPTGTTINNSPLVGPKQMLAIKLLDLQTKQFTTLIPLIDPRNSVTALAHAVRDAAR